MVAGAGSWMFKSSNMSKKQREWAANRMRLHYLKPVVSEILPPVRPQIQDISKYSSNCVPVPIRDIPHSKNRTGYFINSTHRLPKTNRPLPGKLRPEEYYMLWIPPYFTTIPHHQSWKKKNDTAFFLIKRMLNFLLISCFHFDIMEGIL